MTIFKSQPQLNLPQLLKDVTVVLQAANKATNVLSTSIPTEFFESQPVLISESFLLYLNRTEDFPITSVNERLDQDYYTTVYQLYHDIKLSAYIQLNQLEIGSEQYVQIDKFYKFAIEFLLRETFRFATDLHEFSNLSDEKENTKISEFETLISQDFIKISTSYTLSNTEAYIAYTSSNIPLFTSTTQRSSLDERNITLPADLQVTSILPHTSSSIVAPNLNTISPVPARILQQQQTLSQPIYTATGSVQPYPVRDILDRFLHPNWYSLPAAKWLANSDLQSFAPCVDEQISVVTSEDKARLWFETIGYSKLFSISKELETKIDEDDLQADVGTEITMDVEEPDLVLDDIEFTADDDLPNKGSIKLTNLFEWHPSNTLTTKELDIFKKGEEEEYINSLLARLSHLKSLREPKNPATFEEVQLYHKLNFLLKEVILNSNEVPNLEVSKNMPVSQTNYNGVLPVPNQGSIKKKAKASRR